MIMTNLNQKSVEKRFTLLERAEYHGEKGEIRIGGADWILMGAATFRDLISGTERMLGSPAIVVWWEIGKHAGRECAEVLLRQGTKFEELLLVLQEFFTQGGWGKVQTNVDLMKKEALVTIRNSPTARHTESKEPTCHFIRGFIAGVCRVMFDDSAECVETKCMAKGDALCEFQVKNK